MMLQSGISGGFWAEAILTANHIRSRCPSRSLNGEISFKIWTGRTPVVSYFQRFGTTAFMLDKTTGKGKFDSRSNPFSSGIRLSLKRIDCGTQNPGKFSDAETSHSPVFVKNRRTSQSSSMKMHGEKTQKFTFKSSRIQEQEERRKKNSRKRKTNPNTSKKIPTTNTPQQKIKLQKPREKDQEDQGWRKQEKGEDRRKYSTKFP